MIITIIGAGFSGIGMAVTLVKAGYTDLVLLERGDDVGGVWRDNTYPGAACDVASHLYSFSFAPQAAWSRRFAPQREIHAYLQRVARDFDITRRVRFGHEVRQAVYDEARRGWDVEVTTASGAELLRTDVLITACGQLSRPAYPDLPGLEDFAGTTFHSADWDHAHDLTGERVAVLGTGASAIQFVPEIVEQAAHVTVLQRSAPWVLPKPDYGYSPRIRGLLAAHPLLLKADRARTFATNELRSLGFNTDPRLLERSATQFRRHLAEQVADPDLRERLTPTDHIGCKRILQSNDWYPALVRPTVEVVTSPVTRVLPAGVHTADGLVHEADTLILGTGFTATDLLVPIQVIGAGGQALGDAWAGGAEAYLGSAVAGFPNLFLLYGPNTNLGHNSIILMLESQFRWTSQAVLLTRAGGSVEVRPGAQKDYNTWLQKRLGGTVFATGCQSWYLTSSGKNTMNWPGTTLAFRRRTRHLAPADVLVRPPASIPAAGRRTR